MPWALISIACMVVSGITYVIGCGTRNPKAMTLGLAGLIASTGAAVACLIFY